MFNPLKYRYRASFVGEESNDIFLQMNQGGRSEILRFPKALLPPEWDYQKGIQLGIHPPQDNNDGDLGTLKQLLQELIN